MCVFYRTGCTWDIFKSKAKMTSEIQTETFFYWRVVGAEKGSSCCRMMQMIGGSCSSRFVILIHVIYLKLLIHSLEPNVTERCYLLQWSTYVYCKATAVSHTLQNSAARYKPGLAWALVSSRLRRLNNRAREHVLERKRSPATRSLLSMIGGFFLTTPTY